MTHPKDLKYIEEMLPNISSDVIEKQKTLQPGNCVAFGGAFKIPMIIRMNMPEPPPYSSNCNVNKCWGMPAKIAEVTSAPENIQTQEKEKVIREENNMEKNASSSENAPKFINPAF